MSAETKSKVDIIAANTCPSLSLKAVITILHEIPSRSHPRRMEGGRHDHSNGCSESFSMFPFRRPRVRSSQEGLRHRERRTGRCELCLLQAPLSRSDPKSAPSVSFQASRTKPNNTFLNHNVIQLN